MALQKAITQPNGYDAKYWRLTEVSIDWENGNAQVRLKGYKDQQTRESNPNQGSMDSKRYSIRGELFERFFDMPDLSQIPKWDDQASYSTGVLVMYGDYIWEAGENVSAEEDPPDANGKWNIDTDLRLNRELVYNYVKSTVDEFENATDV